MLRLPLLSCSRFEASTFRFFFAGLALFCAGLSGCGSGNAQFGTAPLTITSVTPASGPVTGGNTVKITGTGFKATNTVWIWSNQAQVVKLVGSTELDVAVPAVTAPRTADVMVSASQSQFARLDSAYTYVAKNPPPPPPVRAATTIVWNPAAATIPVGTAIGAGQLNAIATSPGVSSVPGTFVYSPDAGTTFNAAGSQTLSVSFTPADAASFSGSTGHAAINVITTAVATTTTVTSPVDNAVYGQPISFNATVTASKGAPKGTVTFRDGAASLGSGTLVGGVATFNIDTLNAGAHDITAAYSGDSTHTSSAGSVRKSIGPARVEVKWNPNPATIKVGTPLSSAQLNAFAVTKRIANVRGTFTYAPAAGTIFRAPGPQTLTTTFTPQNSNFLPTSATAVINVASNAADTTTSLSSSAANSSYGQTVSFTATVSSGNGVGNATGTVIFLDGQSPLGTGTVNNGIATLSTAALTAGNHSISAAYSGDASNNASSASISQNVSKAQTSISWIPNPATINVGVPLGAGQLDASASSRNLGNVAGTFVYSPAAGTTFSAAGPQTLSVTFVPNDAANINGANGSAIVNVASTTTDTNTVVASSVPNSTYGQPVVFSATVTSSAGTPSGSVSFLDNQTPLGSGTLNNGVATLSSAGLTAGAHNISASYAGDSTHNGSNGSAAQNVSKAQVAISWSPNPATIGVGVALGAGQLNASASSKFINSVAGSFTYSPAAGTSFNATGTQTLNVIFAPADLANYIGASASAQINVENTTNSSATSVATSAANSTFGQAVTFTANVTSSSGTPTGTVLFSDGQTPLGSSPLANGVATFSTSTLTAGAHSITASYSGDSSYGSSSGSVAQNVSKAAVTISWSPNPATINVGAPLGSGQLDATASSKNQGPVAGTFAYSPAAGTTFSAAGPQTLNVTFTPADAADFNGASGSAAITVASTTVNTTTTLSSSAPNSVFGQSVTFTATVTSSGSPTGTVSFSDGQTVLGNGTLKSGVAVFSTSALTAGAHTITADYGGDSSNHSSSGSASQNVSKAQVTIAWTPSPSTIDVGTPLGAGQLDATASSKLVASVPGAFVYSPASGTSFSSPGPQTLNVTFTPADSADFAKATATAVITVASTTSTTTTALASSVPNSTFGQAVVLTATVSSSTGTPTGSVSFTDGSTALGSGNLAGGVATLSTSALTTGAHSITASYGGDTTHTGSSAAATQNVSKAQVSISWRPNPATINVGAALGAGQLDASASSKYAGAVSGTFAYSPAAGTTFSAAGSQTLSVTFAPDDAADFSGATATATINITSTIAQTTTAVTSSAPNSQLGQSVTFTATVSSGSGTPAGSVSFMDSAAVLGTGNLSGGVASFSTSSLNSGKHIISAVYGGDASNAGSTGSLTQNVSAGAGNYLFVDARVGSDSNPGTQSAPYRTIGAAVNKALSNNVRGISTKVLIGPGVYREYVDIHPSGGQTGAQMTFEAVTPGTAIIAGSDVVSGWQAVNSTEYVHSWSNQLPGCSLPAQWPNLPRIVLANQMVFVNGNPMTQILSSADQQPGTFFEDSSQIHIYPPAGTDMNSALVEVSARSQTLQVNARSNVVLRGLVLEHAGDCINSRGANVFSSTNVLIDQVQAYWNNWGGLGVSASDTVTIQNVISNHNGGVGFGSWQNKNLVLTNVETDYNNWRGAMGAFYDFGMGGTKLMLTHGGQVNQQASYRNQGQGLWFDTDNQSISVDSAALSENLIAGLKLEANQGPFTVTNSSFCSSGAGILVLNTEHITATGNNFYNNGGSTLWQASFFLGGAAGGRSFTNWETGAAMRTFTTNTTLLNNSYTDGGSGQNVFGTYMNGGFWSNFVNSLHSNQNTFYDANTAKPFLDPNGHRDDLNGWQNATGQDPNSTWVRSSNAANNCAAPPPSYPDFYVEANNRENSPQDVGVAPYYMSGGSVNIPLQIRSFSYGPVTLSTSNLPSGVSASFSAPTLTSGNSVMTLHASSGAATETIPIVVFATSGNRVHTITLLAGIAP